MFRELHRSSSELMAVPGPSNQSVAFGLTTIPAAARRSVTPSSHLQCNSAVVLAGTLLVANALVESERVAV